MKVWLTLQFVFFLLGALTLKGEPNTSILVLEKSKTWSQYTFHNVESAIEAEVKVEESSDGDTTLDSYSIPFKNTIATTYQNFYFLKAVNFFNAILQFCTLLTTSPPLS